jgi:hypothetical protein
MEQLGQGLFVFIRNLEKLQDSRFEPVSPAETVRSIILGMIPRSFTDLGSGSAIFLSEVL